MKSVIFVFLTAIPLLAQPGFRKHSVTLGIGAALPRADLQAFFGDSLALTIGYGYRIHPNFQVDAGLDAIFGAAGVRDFLPTQFGDLRVVDNQFLVPLGGRAIWPLAGGRIQLTGGGGGAYMRFAERVRHPFFGNVRFDCAVCRSRSGWGYYALLGGSVTLDRARHFRVGVTSRVYRGHTDGDPFGTIPGIRTQDQWVNILGEFGLTF